MNIFEYSDYKHLVTDLVAQMPKGGWGQFRLMAETLRVNSTVISQIFRGSRHLTPEQALTLAESFGFNDNETSFFLLLVQKDRAGTASLKKYYEAKEKSQRESSRQIKTRIQKHSVIKEEDKALFYSDWYYSGIRMLSALSTHNTIDEFADYFQLNRSITKKVVDFLLETGLCIEQDGKISVGPKSTHLDNKSPLVNSHRRNWHLKSMERMQGMHTEDLFYSAPMTLSEKDFEAIREELVAAISKVVKRVEKSDEEKLVCLNIDWFGF